MITELKKKMERFGAIISVYDPATEPPDNIAALKTLNQFAGFAYLHCLGHDPVPVDPNQYGLTMVEHSVTPQLKTIIGHYLSQFRGDGLVAFINPNTYIQGNAAAIYDYVDKNRMERTFGFYIGGIDNPSMIGVSGSMMEHIFHAIPDSMSFGSDWLYWLSGWIQKTLLGGRYFDANGLISVKVVYPTPKEEEPVKIEEKSLPEPSSEPVEVPVPVKRKPGRPKKVK